MYIDCLIEISSSVNDLNHKPDSVTQVYFLLGKKKSYLHFLYQLLCWVFLFDISFLHFHHVKTIGSLVAVFMSSDDIALWCIIAIFGGILELSFYVYFYMLYCSWDLACCS